MEPRIKLAHKVLVVKLIRHIFGSELPISAKEKGWVQVVTQFTVSRQRKPHSSSIYTFTFLVPRPEKKFPCG